MSRKTDPQDDEQARDIVLFRMTLAILLFTAFSFLINFIGLVAYIVLLLLGYHR